MVAKDFKGSYDGQEQATKGNCWLTYVFFFALIRI